MWMLKKSDLQILVEPVKTSLPLVPSPNNGPQWLCGRWRSWTCNRWRNLPKRHCRWSPNRKTDLNSYVDARKVGPATIGGTSHDVTASGPITGQRTSTAMRTLGKLDLPRIAEPAKMSLPLASQQTKSHGQWTKAAMWTLRSRTYYR